MQKSFIFVKKKFKDKHAKDKKHCKIRDNCHYAKECRGAAHSICNLRYRVPKKVLIASHNDLTMNIMLP